ncbi:MAG: hypothetical protein HC769_11030 [Cyanobacteria bacterium CRU_2_1]|nr:hypothetical protein [Cyanobacteria bacterium RU_5_0]NJR59329.1 hypothetical protein [Cyanobacteria bacterium CRU_2_1]
METSLFNQIYGIGSSDRIASVRERSFLSRFGKSIKVRAIDQALVILVKSDRSERGDRRVFDETLSIQGIL